ncbi:hypothetical protein DFJ73DRAFT_869932 [Zopfochytrium polystomum]|nr:hypothetical protein DFJ73DRAFT_869932 [Zopfochytrium polystomum]
MTFGTELWDQWHEVEEFVSEGVRFMHGINEFMKKRAEIELEYSRSMGRLIKPYKDEIARRSGDKKASPVTKAIVDSTSMQAWTQVLAEAENIATIHQSISDKLDHELRKTIKYQANDNDKKIKEMFDEIRKANLEMQKQLTTLDRSRERFEVEKKSMEAARSAFEKISKNTKATDKEIEAAKAESDKRALLATDAMEAYQKCIGETNEKKNNHYTNFLPNILRDVQTNNENFNIRATRVALVKYHELLSTVIPTTIEGHENLSAAVQQMSAERDSELLISNLKTDEPVPPDYLFEEKASAKDMTVKRPATARTLARTESERLMDKDDDDTILAMPPKKGRRAAVERIKALERDQYDLEKKRQAVELLLHTYHQKPNKDPKNLDELNTQTAVLSVRLDNLGLRRHRLEAFVASIDNQPPPDLPAHLAGKSIQPVPSPVHCFPTIAPDAGGVSSPTGAAGSATANGGVVVESPAGANGAAAAGSGGSNESLSGGAGGVGGSSGFAASPRKASLNVLQSSKAVAKEWSTAASGPGRVRMMYDFEAAPGSQELSAAAGDVLEVLEKQDDGWWKAKLFVGGVWKEGFIPGNYTEAA